MCTAATYYAKDHYFGRNLDLEFSYHEEITIVPRNYPFIFRKCEGINHHYAMIGTAFVVEGYPLFYDAVNEKGLFCRTRERSVVKNSTLCRTSR